MKATSERETSTVTFGDLVEAFYDAAMEACGDDEQEAGTIALVALQHFLISRRRSQIACRTDRGRKVGALALACS
jgi:hypothetical protein